MKNFEAKIEQRKVADLIPSAKNARTHSEEQIKQLVASIKEFGFVNPVLIDKKNGIIAGHGRVLAAAKSLLKTVPVIVMSHLNEVQIRALAIADNKIPMNAGWDTEILKTELSELSSEDLESEVLGFSEEEMRGILRKEIDERPEEEPELDEMTQIETDIKLGDVIELGRHKLICGDCTELSVVKKLVGEEKVSMVMTDPPYAIYGSSTGIASDITDDKMIRPFFKSILTNCTAVLKPFGHVYLCCDWRSWSSWWEVAKGTGLSAKNMIVWDKGGGLGSMYANAHELLMFLSFRPLRQGMSQKISGERTVQASNVWRINRAAKSETGEKRMHNAQKPLELAERAERAIESSSDKDESVLDLFLGSGTTLIAAEKAGRRCFATEIEPRYCQLSINRYRLWCEKTGVTFCCSVNGKPVDMKDKMYCTKVSKELPSKNGQKIRSNKAKAGKGKPEQASTKQRRATNSSADSTSAGAGVAKT